MSATRAFNATIYSKLFVWFANLAMWTTIYRTVHIVNWYLLTFLYVARIVKLSSDTLFMCARHYQHTNTLFIKCFLNFGFVLKFRVSMKNHLSKPILVTPSVAGLLSEPCMFSQFFSRFIFLYYRENCSSGEKSLFGKWFSALECGIKKRWPEGGGT